MNEHDDMTEQLIAKLRKRFAGTALVEPLAREQEDYLQEALDGKKPLSLALLADAKVQPPMGATLEVGEPSLAAAFFSVTENFSLGRMIATLSQSATKEKLKLFPVGVLPVREKYEFRVSGLEKGAEVVLRINEVSGSKKYSCSGVVAEDSYVFRFFGIEPGKYRWLVSRQKEVGFELLLRGDLDIRLDLEAVPPDSAGIWLERLVSQKRLFEAGEAIETMGEETLRLRLRSELFSIAAWFQKSE